MTIQTPVEANARVYATPKVPAIAICLDGCEPEYLDRAIEDGLMPTNIDTQTYLFAADIIRQPEMDPEVVDSPDYSAEMIPALKSIRSLSIVTDVDNLFDNSTGILANTPDAVAPYGQALTSAAAGSTYARALATAGRTWLRVLAQRVDTDDVTAAARTLCQFGLTWEATRLASQAALHSPDARVSGAMLQLARDLKHTIAADESALSERPSASPRRGPRRGRRRLHGAPGLPGAASKPP